MTARDPRPKRSLFARRLRRLAGGVLVCIAVVAVAAIAFRAHMDQWATERLEGLAADRLGARLRIGSLHIDPATLTVALSDVSLAMPGTGPERLELTLASGRVRWSPRALLDALTGRFRFEEVVLDRPRLHWVESPATEPTDAAPRADPLDLRIARLKITDGGVSFVDDELPWSLEAERVDLEAAWRPSANALVGRLAMRLEIERAPLSAPFAVGLRTGFRLRRHDVEVESLEIEGEGVTASFDGTARWLRAPAVVGRGEATVDLARIRPWLAPETPELAGEVSATFNLDGAPGALNAHGSIDSRELRVGRLRAEGGSARARLSPGRLELDELQARVFDGRITGALASDWSGEHRVRLDLEGSGMQGHAILEYLGIALPATCRAEGKLTLDAEPGHPESWNGGGSFVLRPESSVRGRIPVGGSGTLEIDAGLVGLRGELEAAASRIDLKLRSRLGGEDKSETELWLGGTTQNARDTQLAVMRVAEQLGLALPEIARQRLGGVGDFRTHIALGETTAMELALDLAGGRYASHAFDRAALELRLVDDRLELSEFELTRGSERVSGSAALRLTPLAVQRLRVEAHDLDAAWLLTAADLELDVSGRIEADLDVREDPAGRTGAGTIRLVDGRLLGEPFVELASELRIEPDAVHFEGARLLASGAELRGGGRWKSASGDWMLRVDEGELKLAELDAVRRRGLTTVAGTIGLVGEWNKTADGVSGRAVIEGREWSFADRPLGDTTGNVQFDDDGTTLELAGADGDWAAAGSIGWGPEFPVDATLTLSEFVVDLAAERPAANWALVSGSFDVGGPLSDPARIHVAGRVERASVQWGVKRLEIAPDVQIDLLGGHLSVESMRLTGEGTDVVVHASHDVASGQLHASARGTVDLGVFTAPWSELRAWGDVVVAIEVNGDPSSPDVKGTLECTAGRIRWLGFPQALDALSFHVALDGQTAALERARGRLGNGEVRATGRANLAALDEGDYRIDGEIANVRAAYPRGFSGIYEGEFHIGGEPNGTTIGGRLTMLRGLYDEEFELGLTGGTREYVAGDVDDAADEIFLDLRLTGDGNIWVRNELAELETGLDLHLGGSIRKPQLTGRVWVLDGGEIDYRDVEYRVTYGSLDFVDLDRIDPELTLRAETTVDIYTVFLRVQRSMGRLDYELTSEPALNTRDIITLLATGRVREEDDPAGFGGDVAASYFSGAIAGPVSKQIERVLGLKSVRIDPLLAEGESDPTTRITVAEEVADDVFVVISTDLSQNERQLYKVDWRATDRFRLTVQRDTQGGIGGDIRYTDRFWWNAPPEGPAQQGSGETAALVAPMNVAALRVVGVSAEEREDLLTRIPLAAGRSFTRSEMFRGVEAIKRYYVDRQRIEVRVDAAAQETPEGKEVTYEIDPGPVVDVAFVGTTGKETRRLRAALEQLWVQSAFSEDVYDDAVELIREFYHDRGYYVADVGLKREVLEDRVSVRFQVDRGVPVRVTSVTIRGAEQIPEERVRGQMLTRPSSVLTRRVLVPEVLADDVAAIRALYRSEGFLAVQIRPPEIGLSIGGESAEVGVVIEEGGRFTIAEITFPGELPFEEEELLDWCGLETGQVYSPPAMLDAESRLRSEVDARGYPDARVRGEVRVEGENARVRFDLVPGQRKRVGEISIVGNHLTRRKVVRRELELEQGELLSRNALIQSQHRLYRLGIFRNVRLDYQPIDPDDPELQRVEVRVDESAPLTSSVGVGWDTEADGRFTFALTNENVGGYDRVLGIHGKVSGLERRLGLVGKEPRLFARRFPALMSLGWSEEERFDFTLERLSTALRVDRRLGPKWRAFLRYNLQRVVLSDVEISPEELEEEKLVEGRLGDLGLTFIRDTRDDPFLTRSGGYLAVGSRWFAIPLASEFTFVKNDATASVVLPLRRASSFFSSARIGLAIPYGPNGAVPISEAYFAGGDSTLRGFPRDEVGPASGGEALLILNEEIRFPLWRALKGVVFYDVGNVYDEVGKFDPTDLRHVLGAGFRLETPIGPIRLEYGGKLDREEDESIGELFLAIGWAF